MYNCKIACTVNAIAPFSGRLSVGTWKDLSILEDPGLQELAAKLPGTIVQSCLPHSQTDQFRKGDKLVKVRTGNTTFPVAMLELYMRQTHTSWNDKCFFFKPICKAKMGKAMGVWLYIVFMCLCNLFKKNWRP